MIRRLVARTPGRQEQDRRSKQAKKRARWFGKKKDTREAGKKVDPGRKPKPRRATIRKSVPASRPSAGLGAAAASPPRSRSLSCRLYRACRDRSCFVFF